MIKKYTLLLSVLFIGLLFNSCTAFDDGVDDRSQIGQNPGTGDPDTGNTDNGNTGGQTDKGDYWPTVIGNEWVYNQNGTTSGVKIISSENIKGATYFKFDQLAGAGNGITGAVSSSIKKVQGDYYLKVDEVVYNSDGIKGKTSGYEYILFKDYLEVDKKWKGNYTQETSFDIQDFPVVKMVVIYTGTILEKGITMTIRDVNYKDVIRFNLRQETSLQGQNSTTDTEYWIAKNVGIIKMSVNGVSSELVSYNLKK